MMKKISAAFLILLAGTVLCAQTPRELAIENLELSKSQKILESTINTYVDAAIADNPNANREGLIQRFNEIMGWEVLKEEIINLMLEAYTPGQIAEINAFLRTDTGKVYTEKSPWFAEEFSKIVVKNLKKVRQKNAEANEQLLQIANETNANLPMTIDEHTRLNHTTAGKDKFTYNYTLTQLSAEEISPEELESAILPNIVGVYCTNPDLKFFRDNHVVMYHYYADKNGKHITTLSADTSDCE